MNKFALIFPLGAALVIGCGSAPEEGETAESASSATSAVTARPAAPVLSDPVIAGCNGAYYIAHTTVPGATSYQWYIKPEKGGGSFEPYTSSEIGRVVVASPGDYFVLEACNSAGCSGHSNEQLATYYAGCP